MAVSDWNDKIGTGAFLLTTEKVYAGEKSLKVDNSVTFPAIRILNKSEIDEPEDVIIQTQLLLKYPSLTDNWYEVGFFARYTDLDNHFRLRMKCSKVSYPTGKIEFYLERRETANNDSIFLGNIQGAYFESWHKWEIRFCEAPAGTFTLEVYVDDDFKHGAGLAESLQTKGGLGIGNISVGPTPLQDFYFDETKIYY